MSPEICDPAGLKYRKKAAFQTSASSALPILTTLARWEVMKSVMQVSTVTLVLPYGFVGPSGQISGIGIMLGKRVASPYTVAEEEKTMLVT